MKKLKLKKSVISALSSSEQGRIIGGDGTVQDTIVQDPDTALLGSRLLYCATRNGNCTKSCNGPICFPPLTS